MNSYSLILPTGIIGPSQINKVSENLNKSNFQGVLEKFSPTRLTNNGVKLGTSGFTSIEPKLLSKTTGNRKK